MKIPLHPQQLIAIDEYEPHPDNYNDHPEEQIVDLVESLESFGQVKGVVVWRNFIVAGHGIVLAARQLDMETLKAEILPEEWSYSKALAYLAADNELPRAAVPNIISLAELAERIRKEEGDTLARLSAGGTARLAELSALLAVPDVEFQEFDESIADDVDMVTCPSCGHEFPA